MDHGLVPVFSARVSSQHFASYQGADIDEHYNIYNINRMDRKQLYTCLSHTSKYEYVHLNSHQLNYKYDARRLPLLELTNSHFNSDFFQGKVYGNF